MDVVVKGEVVEEEAKMVVRVVLEVVLLTVPFTTQILLKSNTSSQSSELQFLGYEMMIIDVNTIYDHTDAIENFLYEWLAAAVDAS